MGQLPLLPGGDRPALRTLRYSHKYGYIQPAGGDKLVVHISFEDVLHGAPAILKWLSQRGCRDFKYEFSSAGVLDYDWDE